jgi:glycosyltransferase involved in cell wall biosynthesis
VQNRTIDRACFQDFDVYFMGNVSNPFSFMSRASLFLFPSEWEGFPLAMVEAMIVGVPVLASDCRTGPREILCPRGTLTGYDIQTAEFTGAGVLLPIPRTKAQIDLWSAVVLELISAPARRRSMIRGAALRAAHFDRDVVFGKWRELIGSLSTHQD